MRREGSAEPSLKPRKRTEGDRRFRQRVLAPVHVQAGTEAAVLLAPPGHPTWLLGVQHALGPNHQAPPQLPPQAQVIYNAAQRSSITREAP